MSFERLGRAWVAAAALVFCASSAAIADQARANAVKACKEHVDRVMKSPTGTEHSPDVKVDHHGGAKFTVAGWVNGLRGGTEQIKADWECDVEQVGSGLMHTKTRLYLPR
jgi:hypothetical protein